MTEKIAKKMENRPDFPKRAVVTGGMPYGNKELHLGHVGAVFVHADTFARFMRDRIGYDNVIFVSGTDCYGSPITEAHRTLGTDESIEEFVRRNHEVQKQTLTDYDVDITLYAASALGTAAEVHREMSEWFIKTLRGNGYLQRESTMQFYDPELQVFLNGRQVTGRCPINGCPSDNAYADECALGHQYPPHELINPKSTLTGKPPEMRRTENWYFRLPEFAGRLKEWLSAFSLGPQARTLSCRIIEEFLAPPVIYLKRDYLDELGGIDLPKYEIRDEKQSKTSVALVFEDLPGREEACEILNARGMNFRTGKTLVPFRLTGNAEWGVPAPVMDGLDRLTFWVWPESLWAPVSFTKTVLDSRGESPDAWRKWWCGPDCGVYQFIGQDNLYFYGPAEMALFMAVNASAEDENNKFVFPNIIANGYLMLGDKKASSSGSIKPPTANELLEHYTNGQLRAHFLSLGLSMRSVNFRPKAFDPDKDEKKEPDPVLKEGNLFTNVLNRIARSCFYTAQKYTDSKLPDVKPSAEAVEMAAEAALDYETMMFRCEFHLVMNLLDSFIRGINKLWVKNMREADENNDNEKRMQTLADCFHLLRTATVLAHPVSPSGAELLASYFSVGSDFFSWERIFDTPDMFVSNRDLHKLKFLEPRFDFFEKHPSQLS